MTELRRRAALIAALLCGAGLPSCGVDDRLLSPCQDDRAGGAGGGGAQGTGGSTSVVDGSSDAASGGRGGGEPDAGGSGGSPEDDSGACSDCPPGNVVANADFDSDIGGWSAEPRSRIEWDAEDASGLSSSGSIQVHNDHVEDVENQTAVGARQCLEAVPGATYELAAKVLIRLTEGAGNGHVNVGFFAGSSCEAPQLPKGGFTTTSAFRLGAWENERGSIVAPPGSRSIAVRLVAQKPLRQETLAVVFDEVRITVKK